MADINALIHGKVHTYNKGCRCDECKAAKAKARKKSFARSKLPKVKIYSYFEEGFNILVYLIHSTIENTMAEIKLRIDQDLKDQLKKIAKSEGRSLNKQVEIFLDDAVLNRIANSREDQKRISVKLEDL